MDPLLSINQQVNDLLEQIELLHEDNISIPVQEHFKLITLRKALNAYLELEK